MKNIIFLFLALTITACSSSSTKRTIANDPCAENYYTDENQYFDLIDKCRGR
ncbi:hypothetical protein [Halobacteriovorax sp. HLS]|uniref:hypothetical protein n=1 Tax=Halobacteriovorax sp. HLS TaxID=2234000 RepID=UPI0013E3F911|nr:hypothetical protein [Halobacteriovorax sp. HLS]